MPRDIHNQTVVTGATQPLPYYERRAGLVLASMAITEELSPSELSELLEMIGVKKSR